MKNPSQSHHKQLTDEVLEMIAAQFRLLAEPMRLKLLQALNEGEMSVGELVEITKAGQANVSKHLIILLDAGIVTKRKEGVSVIYRIADESVFELCELVCDRLGKRLESQQNRLKQLIG
jgi:DNA-binding transcriptional ArsR family regulator